MPRYTQPRKTWQYTQDFKVKAVKLSYQPGIQVKQVAEGLDIHPFMLSRWRKEYREGKLQGDNQKRVGVNKKKRTISDNELTENARLKKENERLRKENDLPKKVATVSCGTTSERFGFIHRYRELGIVRLCEWLKVSPSGYHAWKNRKESKRSLEDKELLVYITKIFVESEGRYGSPRVFKSLREQGFKVGENRVCRLMREAGLKARVTRVTRRQPGLKRFQRKGENLLRQVGKPTGINQTWVADVTYLKVNGKWQYLATVMDLYSRRIIGWSLSANRTAGLTCTALRYAYRKRGGPKGIVFHTDRGVEYTGSEFQELLSACGFRHSVNRLGYCTDNAFMESFFHSMKAELIRGSVYRSARELRKELARYINKFYNRVRLHSSLDYMPPIKYEQIAA
ncbi:MAG: IS3 family transposase [Candidatus Thiodiazotropha taylori]|nr:IS3 family transposase [Candidatus Thiodiazotropha taylori]